MRARRRCGDPFGATVIQTGSISSTQTGPEYQNLYAADLFFPNRHAHLSLYQVLSRQSICILCFVYISYSQIIIVVRKSYMIYIYNPLFISFHFSYLITCINKYAYHVCLRAIYEFIIGIYKMNNYGTCSAYCFSCFLEQI